LPRARVAIASQMLVSFSRVLRASARVGASVRLSSSAPAAAGPTAPYEMLRAETVGGGRVRLLTLHRPAALNALCGQLIAEINAASAAADADDAIGAIVLTGSPRAFAAGADIKEMAKKTFAQVFGRNMFSEWAAISRVSKPTIAAVRARRAGAAARRSRAEASLEAAAIMYNTVSARAHCRWTALRWAVAASWR
jgi:enoyl-CoA hydratase/carnithine racemase